MSIDTVVEEYRKLCSFKEKSVPILIYNNELIHKYNPSIYVSSLETVLGGCTYKWWLEQKRLAETDGEGYEPEPAARERMEAGTKNHSKMADLRDPTLDSRDYEGTREDFFKEVLTYSLKEDVEVAELYIPGVYKNLYFGGQIDYSMFKGGLPVKIEEWKFSNKPKMQWKYIHQAEVYCFFLYQLFGVCELAYSIKVWDLNVWNKEKQYSTAFRDEDKVPPQASFSTYVRFTEPKMSSVKVYLNNAVRLFKGQDTCKENFSPFCPGNSCAKDCEFCKGYSSPEEVKKNLKEKGGAID